jgi:hypothetical protein
MRLKKTRLWQKARLSAEANGERSRLAGLRLRSGPRVVCTKRQRRLTRLFLGQYQRTAAGRIFSRFCIFCRVMRRMQLLVLWLQKSARCVLKKLTQGSVHLGFIATARQKQAVELWSN